MPCRSGSGRPRDSTIRAARDGKRGWSVGVVGTDQGDRVPVLEPGSDRRDRVQARLRGEHLHRRIGGPLDEIAEVGLEQERDPPSPVERIERVGVALDEPADGLSLLRQNDLEPADQVAHAAHVEIREGRDHLHAAPGRVRS